MAQTTTGSSFGKISYHNRAYAYILDTINNMILELQLVTYNESGSPYVPEELLDEEYGATYVDLMREVSLAEVPQIGTTIRIHPSPVSDQEAQRYEASLEKVEVPVIGIFKVDEVMHDANSGEVYLKAYALIPTREDFIEHVYQLITAYRFERF